MIRPNNPDIDFTELRSKVEATAAKLRAAAALENKGSTKERNVSNRILRMYFRAANAYVDKSDDFAYPSYRLPHRLAIVERLNPLAARFLLRAYNLVMRPAREASRAHTMALREIIQAGTTMTQRLTELEKIVAELREAVERNDHQTP